MISGYIICNFSSWMYQSGKQIWISALQMWGRCLLGKWVVNICNLFSHCLFIFGHPKILVDSISECITRCITEVLTLLLGCSQASFCILLRAILGAQGCTAPACSPCHTWCLLQVTQLLGAGCPPCSIHGFLSWMALAAWLFSASWLSGSHFYLVSWPACPGKLRSPGRLVKLLGWPAFSFSSLPFSPLLTHGACWLPLFISPCLCASHSFLDLLWSSRLCCLPVFRPSALLLFCFFVSLLPSHLFPEGF